MYCRYTKESINAPIELSKEWAKYDEVGIRNIGVEREKKGRLVELTPNWD
jgi:hypothetical protein